MEYTNLASLTFTFVKNILYIYIYIYIYIYTYIFVYVPIQMYELDTYICSWICMYTEVHC